MKNSISADRGNVCESDSYAFFYCISVQLFCVYTLIFFEKWVMIVIQVVESGWKWYKVVDKLITLWITGSTR